MCVLYPANQIRRICRRGDIEDIRAGLQAGFKIRFLSRDRHYHGDIHSVTHERQHLVRGRVIEHDAGRALHLGKHGKVYRPLPLRESAADAGEHGDIRRGEQRLGYHGLRREGIHGQDRVGVDVSDDAQIGREHERFDALSENDYTAALINAFGHTKCELTQRTINSVGQFFLN